MISGIKSLLSEAKLANNKLLEQTRGLVGKWSKTGLLEGITNEYEKAGTAILLENQLKQLLSEASRTGTAQGAEEWSGVALPLVRRIFSEIAAKDFVSVQPMNLPSGLVFYLDFKYGTSGKGFQTTQSTQNPKMPGYQQNSVFGITNSAGDPSQGLYGPGRFGYSINVVSSSALTLSSSLSAANYVTASVTAADYNYDSRFFDTYSASIAAGLVKTVTIAASAIPKFDFEGIRSFELSSSANLTTFKQFTRISSNDQFVTFVVLSGNVNFGSITTLYSIQPTADNRGDFEAGLNGQPIDTDINIPQLNVELRSLPIVAKTRKLKAVWTPEFAQDLNAYHAIDAEVELTSMLSEYVSQEIDMEILEMLIQNAVTKDAWSAEIGTSIDATTGQVSTATNAAMFNQGTWFQTLGTKMQKMSNKIHQKTLRGGANFAVVSPDVATILESIPGYAPDGVADKGSFAMGVQKVGLLNNRFTVYKNPYMIDNLILMGYRGSQFLECGAVYAPYVPLMMTPLVYDPNNFTPRKAVHTRYAKQIVRPEFFGVIYVSELGLV